MPFPIPAQKVRRTARAINKKDLLCADWSGRAVTIASSDVATARLGDLVRSGGATVFVNQAVEALLTQNWS